MLKSPPAWLAALGCRPKPRSRPHLFSGIAGFTLVELVVAMAVGSLISAGLLFVVVQLLETNKREADRSNTQREAQMALDYISRDVREAVYVYDGNCLVSGATGLRTQQCPGLLDALPDKIAGKGTIGANTLPVLAFWKSEELPQSLIAKCEAKASDFSQVNTPVSAEIEGVPCVSRRMYTLVVYTLDWGPDSGKWQGKARIKRYKLPHFIDSAGAGAGVPPVNPGWAYPAGENTGFASWPNDKQGTRLTPYYPNAADNSNNQVLLDFVDLDGGTNPTCPDPAPAVQPGPPPVYTPGYVMTPDSSVTNSSKRGFYVCVKGGESYGNLNQEVLIRLQGSTARKVGGTFQNSNAIPMETRVLTRGVLNKNL